MIWDITIHFTIDQLNTSVHATMKSTPFELVFGQPPRNNIFPGAVGIVMEEDVAELLDEGSEGVASRD